MGLSPVVREVLLFLSFPRSTSHELVMDDTGLRKRGEETEEEGAACADCAAKRVLSGLTGAVGVDATGSAAATCGAACLG